VSAVEYTAGKPPYKKILSKGTSAFSSFNLSKRKMADTLKDIPEFFETELGESIAARTDALGSKLSRDILENTLNAFIFRHIS
jgi:hypothetical protein